MKKTIFVFICALFGLKMASAQYYSSAYGSPTSFEQCNSGIVTTGTPGYVLAGWQIAQGGIQSVNVVHTDLNGSIAAGFNKTFTLLDPGTNAPYIARGTDVVQNSNGNFYVVGWVVIISGIYYPFMMELDASGNFMACTVYQYTNANSSDIRIVQDLGSTDMFISSLYDYGQGMQSIAAFRVNPAGNLVWGNIYDIFDPAGPANQIQSAHANGLLVSPWPPQPGNSPNELYVFGTAKSVTGRFNPIVMIIDGATGALAPVPVIQHDYGVDAEYTSCDVSLFSGGFIAAGWCHNGGINDYNALTTNMQPLGTINWATMHDNSFYPGQYNTANGVKERSNSEIYTAGFVYDIPSAMSSAQVLKINNAGNVVTESLFSSGNYETGTQLAFDPSGDGLAVFGSMGGASNNDMFTVKMYFNGVMRCDSAKGKFTSTPMNVNVINPAANGFAVAGDAYALNVSTASLSETPMCPNVSSVPGGSNALAAHTNPTLEVGFSLVQAGNILSIASLAHNPQINDRCHIAVYDLAGKQLFTTSSHITPGSTQAFDLAACRLSPGYYLFIVSNNGTSQSLKVSIAK